MVIIADFTAIGDHVGLLAKYSAAAPAMWGDDIDVPEEKSNN